MPATPNDPDARRRLPLWARVVLALGLVPVIVLAPVDETTRIRASSETLPH
jgi:hypothetical protein